MVNRRKSEVELRTTPRAPAKTPIERENQMVALAFDLAEKQLQEGTASAAVILQLLKYGSRREKLEQYKLQMENELLATKREILESEKRTEDLVRAALEAMRSYTGANDDASTMVIDHQDDYGSDPDVF